MDSRRPAPTRFAALIQQLLGGAGDEENFAMLMQQMDAVQKQDEEEGTDLAMQMMAELLKLKKGIIRQRRRRSVGISYGVSTCEREYIQSIEKID